MKKFWNWIKNSDDTRILRLEGPIDEESFWGDEITPQMFRDELESGEGDRRTGRQLFTRRAGAANGFGKGKRRIPHN